MQSKRRTKTAMKSTNPKWNQTFVYPCRPQKVREIVLWFYFGFVQPIISYFYINYSVIVIVISYSLVIVLWKSLFGITTKSGQVSLLAR